MNIINSNSFPGRYIPGLLLFVFFLSTFVFSIDLSGQTIYRFRNQLAGTVHSTDPNLVGTDLSRGAGISAGDCVGNTDGFGAQGWPATAFDLATHNSAGEYIEFTITPSATYQFTITGFQTRPRRNIPGGAGDGPAVVRYAYSTDGGTNWTTNDADLAPTDDNDCANRGSRQAWDNFTAFKTTSSIIFRIYGASAGLDGTGDLYLEEVIVQGFVAIPTYFRTQSDGNWNATSTWEESADNMTWVNATTVPNRSAEDVTIRAGHSVIATANVDIDDFTIEATGELTVNSGVTFRVQDGEGTDGEVAGTINNEGTCTANGTMTFSSGSTYTHNVNDARIPAATWDANSNCEVTGVENAITTSGLRQAFGNFTWNSTLMNTDISLPGSFSVQGDLLIEDTGSAQLQNSQSLLEVSGNCDINGGSLVIAPTNGNRTLSVGGDFTISGGTLDMTQAPSNANRTGTLKIGGDFIQNGGTITETGVGTGIIAFCGSADQDYSSSGGTFSNDIDFSMDRPMGSTGALTLSSPLSISGEFEFTNGIINTTDANLITFEDGSSVSGGSATSFIDGPVAKVGAGDFVFPIGDGSTWAQLGITDLTANSTFTAQYFQGTPPDADDVTGLMRVSKIEYWTLDRSSGGDAKVTLYFEDRVTSGITSPGDLRVARYDGSTWTNESITTFQDLVDGSGSVTSGNVSSFSPFTFGANTAFSVNPLPVELTHFKARLQNGDAYLDWGTSTELNNDYFSVEYSTDGQFFTEIGEVKGAGSTQVPQVYEFIHREPVAGPNYYRLRQVDFDGAFEYSDVEVVFVEGLGDKGFTVFPSPAYDFTNLRFAEPLAQEATLNLYMAGGALISTTKLAIGTRSYELGLNNLPAGIYNLTVSTGREVWNQRIVVR